MHGPLRSSCQGGRQFASSAAVFGLWLSRVASRASTGRRNRESIFSSALRLTGTWSCDVAYERFLGPEIFFNPEICNPDYTTPVPQVIDQTIQARLATPLVLHRAACGVVRTAAWHAAACCIVAPVTPLRFAPSPSPHLPSLPPPTPALSCRFPCSPFCASLQASPIDTRRGLYKNIVLSGGSTMFKDFGRRLQRDIKRCVDERLRKSAELSNGRIVPQNVDVNVISHHMQASALLPSRISLPKR